jgi:choline dehydrogenase-like flavoprotein
MIEDARRVPEDPAIEADICIIGAGPAGLTLARYFANSRIKVVLLESGGLDFERWPQKLSRGDRAGDPYEPLHICRVRQFGGTTHRAGWGGWCKPLSPRDFEARDWVPRSGWPIRYDEVEPYYAEAAQLLNLPPSHDWAPRPLTDREDGGLLSEPCAITPTPAQGELAYAELRDAPNVIVLLHATAGRLALGEDSSAIGYLPVHCRGAEGFGVRARHYVLAGGGIENARMLLVSNEQRPKGIGNEHDLVGRYFMEHPHIRWGHFMSDGPDGFVALHNPRTAQEAVALGLTDRSRQVPIAGLAIARDLQERERILASRSWIKPVGAAGFGPGTQVLHDLTFWFRKGRVPPNIMRGMGVMARNGGEVAQAIRSRLQPARNGPCIFNIDTIVEQDPRFDNRVTLDHRRDPFGLPRARLEWRVGPMAERTLLETKRLIESGLLDSGLASAPGLDRGRANRLERGEQVRCVRHHMGTTRMAENERSGVVNSDGRVFGVHNLYVAGSSIFPTGGNDMPTMTIVAMARRLAGHLESRLAAEPRQDLYALRAVS